MQLTNRSKVVSNKEQSFSERLYLPAIVKGMLITFSHLFKKTPTVRYPDQLRSRAGIYRGQHVLKLDENGAERCTACGMCAVACPAEAITMENGERKKGEEHLYREEKYATKYEINMLRCIFCGLCEEACPKEAIFLTDKIVDAEYERETFIYGKDKLVEKMDKRIDVTMRETLEVAEFKKNPGTKHNELFDSSKQLKKGKH
ncbi:MAG: NADH-quinone oxidoreductase subunit I [Bacteroidota bacterium]|nr:NADH-quinone oxidoreductase subunit I [Bacteroidota bacterium]